MAEINSYYLVSTDTNDLVVYGGPLRWDGETTYAPPAGRKLILVSEAISYSFPARPTAEINAATLQDRAATALTTNGSYLAIASPSNAQIATQVARLTRECSALIRLLLNQTEDITGT